MTTATTTTTIISVMKSVSSIQLFSLVMLLIGTVLVCGQTIVEFNKVITIPENSGTQTLRFNNQTNQTGQASRSFLELTFTGLDGQLRIQVNKLSGNPSNLQLTDTLDFFNIDVLNVASVPQWNGTIRYGYTTAQVSGDTVESELRIVQFRSVRWVTIEGTVNTTNNTVTTGRYRSTDVFARGAHFFAVSSGTSIEPSVTIEVSETLGARFSSDASISKSVCSTMLVGLFSVIVMFM